MRSLNTGEFLLEPIVVVSQVQTFLLLLCFNIYTPRYRAIFFSLFFLDYRKKFLWTQFRGNFPFSHRNHQSLVSTFARVISSVSFTWFFSFFKFHNCKRDDSTKGLSIKWTLDFHPRTFLRYESQEFAFVITFQRVCTVVTRLLVKRHLFGFLIYRENLLSLVLIDPMI